MTASPYSRIQPSMLDPEPRGIVREHDGAFIPADPLNADWQAYQAWLAAGNAPAAAPAA